MRIDRRLALVLAAGHSLTEHAQHPHDAKQVVDVLMRDENLAHVLPAQARMLKLGEQGIPSPAVHKQVFAIVVQHKAGVIALCDLRVASSQKRDLHTPYSSLPAPDAAFS